MIYRLREIDAIAPQGRALLSPDHYAISSDESDPCGIFVRSKKVGAALFTPNVLAVARMGAGFDTIDVIEATKRGICVFAAFGANAQGVVEGVFGALLSHVRNIPAAQSYIKSISGEKDPKEFKDLMEGNKGKFRGSELAGKTMGIIGAGNVGTPVANLAVAFGMRVLVYEPSLKTSNGKRLHESVKLVSMEEVLSQSDIVSVHASYSNEKTHHLIGAEQIALMRKGAIFVNFARAELCDEAAFMHALNDKHLAAYLTDLPNPDVVETSNVTGTPHIGGETYESQERCGVMSAQQMDRYLRFGVVENSVNFWPVAEMPDERAHTRVIIINRDEPGMVAIEAGVFGDARVNIIALTNKSNLDETIGYSVIDFKTPVPLELIERVQKLTGVIKVRAIPMAR